MDLKISFIKSPSEEHTNGMQFVELIGLVFLVARIRASSYGDFLADLQYLYNMKSLHGYYPDDTYSDKLSTDYYPDPMAMGAPKEARDYGEAALRDQEYMSQLPISGYQFISGGTGRQEDEAEVKTDKVLPSYCTPPNPCPQGYTGPDTCVKEFENTPENNRRLLEQQDCPCDAEHMITCPPGKKTIDPKSGFVSDGLGDDDDDDVDALGSLSSFDNIDLDTPATPDDFSDMFPLMTEKMGDLGLNPYRQMYGKSPKSVVKKASP